MIINIVPAIRRHFYLRPPASHRTVSSQLCLLNRLPRLANGQHSLPETRVRSCVFGQLSYGGRVIEWLHFRLQFRLQEIT